MRVPDRISRIAGDWHGDAIIAASLIAIIVVSVAADGLLRGAGNLFDTAAVVGTCGCIAVRRAHPQLAAAAAGAFLVAAGVGWPHSALAESNAAFPGSLILAPILILAYTLGAARDFKRSLLALVVLAGGVQALAYDQLNLMILPLVIGPWAIGLVARSRRHHLEQLALRGRELAAERELFAAEAVRYERARIARELHDIVAHCVSVMVIQASAGQRLTAIDPSLAAEAFDSIGAAARQAETEIGRLVELLDNAPQPSRANSIQLIGELVARAGAAGLAVSCRFTGSVDDLPGQVSDAAYRVVQESLTNAFRHAPGASVQVAVASEPGGVEIGVINGPPAGPQTGLEHAGTGRGLAGMRERVAACGGDFSAGPAEDGGWQVRARLPR